MPTLFALLYERVLLRLFALLLRAPRAFLDWFNRRPRYKVGSMMFCGDTGSFKTFSMWREAMRYRSLVYQNVSPDCVPVAPSQQEVIYYEEPEALASARCAVVCIDEAGLVLDSQKWATLPNSLRKSAFEQRKFHWRLLMTAQKPSSVDNHFRDICPEIILCQSFRVPLLGLLFPDTRVRNLACPHGSKFCDGVCVSGDWHSGTVIKHIYVSWEKWDSYRSAHNAPLPLNPLAKPKKIPDSLRPNKVRYVLYSQRVADTYKSMSLVDESKFRVAKV